MQSIVARRIDPLHAPVLTIATFRSGDSYNVIPATTELAGTIRTHDREVRAKVPAMLEQTLAGICTAYGAEYDLKWTHGYAIGNNHADACGIASDVIKTYLDGTELKPMPAAMFGSEDSSSYLGMFREPSCLSAPETRPRAPFMACTIRSSSWTKM